MKVLHFCPNIQEIQVYRCPAIQTWPVGHGLYHSHQHSQAVTSSVQKCCGSINFLSQECYHFVCYTLELLKIQVTPTRILKHVPLAGEQRRFLLYTRAFKNSRNSNTYQSMFHLLENGDGSANTRMQKLRSSDVLQLYHYNIFRIQVVPNPLSAIQECPFILLRERASK